MASSWIPSWVSRIGSAVWVVGPDRRLRYVNERAEALLEVDAAEVVGLPCYQVLRGVDVCGGPVCAAWCPTYLEALRGKTVTPRAIQVPRSRGNSTWIQILTIAVDEPRVDGVVLVHCATEIDRPHRAEDYLERVASRTPASHRTERLTRREQEVLELLIRDETLESIADALDVSYATVRNHVRHILRKMEAHSILEAVASYLLAGDS